MASLPLRSSEELRFQFPSAPVATPPAVIQPAPRLSAVEWSVVAMAERDTMASLREPGRFALALRSIFGIRPANRLANDRLEAVRRIAVLAWRLHWNVPKSELRQFLSAGFTVDQYELIQKSIGQARAARRRKTIR